MGFSQTVNHFAYGKISIRTMDGHNGHNIVVHILHGLHPCCAQTVHGTINIVVSNYGTCHSYCCVYTIHVNCCAILHEVTRCIDAMQVYYWTFRICAESMHMVVDTGDN